MENKKLNAVMKFLDGRGGIEEIPAELNAVIAGVAKLSLIVNRETYLNECLGFVPDPEFFAGLDFIKELSAAIANCDIIELKSKLAVN